MGLKGHAAIVGTAQYKPEKYATAPKMFHLEQVADLAAQALRDAGLKASDLDGLVINGPHFHEASVFVPAMAAGGVFFLSGGMLLPAVTFSALLLIESYAAIEVVGRILERTDLQDVEVSQ